MDVRRLIFLGIAIFLAGAIAFSVRSAAKPAPAQEAAAPKKELPSVLVAKNNLPAGSFVQPDQLTWVNWPSDNISPSYMKKGEKTADEFAGAVVRSGIAAGEPITEGRIVKPNDRGFMAAVLTPGMRAVSVQINETTGISGFVFPGDRVDVILTQNIRQEGDNTRVRKASETILTDVRVLGVDQRVDDQKPEAKPAKTATLEVTPKQAEKIALIADMGRLSLSLRSLGNETDDEKLAQEQNRRSFMWDSDASALLSDAEQPQKVFVVRGKEVEEVTVGASGKGGS